MTRRLAALALAVAVLGPGGLAAPRAHEAAVSRIEEARALLEEARTALSGAEGAAARRAARGVAVQANEAALAALRGGLRSLAAEDRRLTDALEAERARLSALLGALQSLARAPRSALLAHPDGALAAARSGLLIADLAPRIRAEMAEATRQLDALRAVRLGQEIARAEARGALASLQALRAEAEQSRRRSRSAATAELRRALARQAEEAAARAQDLDDLAATLRASLPEPVGAGRFSDNRGRIRRPVAGRVTGSFGGVDPWGRTGQGIAFTAPAYAAVTAPWDGTIRYAGPLIDYGEVVILEPEEDWLVVLAGLGRTERRVGETVLAGERLGDLGGPLPSSEEFLLEASGAVPQVETSELYVEIRHAGTAVDPAPWFVNVSE